MFVHPFVGLVSLEQEVKRTWIPSIWENKGKLDSHSTSTLVSHLLCPQPGQWLLLHFHLRDLTQISLASDHIKNGILGNSSRLAKLTQYKTTPVIIVVLLREGK